MEYTTYKFYQSAFIDEAEYENLKTITTKNVKYVTIRWIDVINILKG